MKKYLLNVTFYAGSDDKEDIDKGLFLLFVDKETTEIEVKEIFRVVNSLLDYFDVKERDSPISYEQGINIHTLMEGISIYTKDKVEEVKENCGYIQEINNYYVIEQWQ